jgi:hypothetical protein
MRFLSRGILPENMTNHPRKYDWGIFVALLPLVLVQLKTIGVLHRINRKLLCQGVNCFSKRDQDVSETKTAPSLT